MDDLLLRLKTGFTVPIPAWLMKPEAETASERGLGHRVAT